TLNARDQPPAEVSDQRVSGLTGAVQTGDMTSTFNFAVPPNSSWPNLDYPGLHALSTVPQCVPNAALGTINRGIPYRVPDPQIMPTQETTPTRGIPSGPC
ncbi:hypothetical protein ACT3J6_20930, partial [Mycobacterium tuberculosis]